jgi:hypothetical protein
LRQPRVCGWRILGRPEVPHCGEQFIGRRPYERLVGSATIPSLLEVSEHTIETRGGESGAVAAVARGGVDPGMPMA